MYSHSFCKRRGYIFQTEQFNQQKIPDILVFTHVEVQSRSQWNEEWLTACINILSQQLLCLFNRFISFLLPFDMQVLEFYKQFLGSNASFNTACNNNSECFAFSSDLFFELVTIGNKRINFFGPIWCCSETEARGIGKRLIDPSDTFLIVVFRSFFYGIFWEVITLN